MIFVTVGTQLGFDRMLRIAEGAITCGQRAFFQIGESNYIPKFPYARYLSDNDYNSIVAEAELIIGHAGMGTIITGLENQIPCILVPRRSSLNEHRNDHQLDTCAKFKDSYGIFVAETVEEMQDAIEASRSLNRSDLALTDKSTMFFEKLKGYII